jgi:predicted NUDIX family NTP pyrophosphohydrolase
MLEGMSRTPSAGLLLYRYSGAGCHQPVEVLLAHMGGPFWARKDNGAWSIPKGECEPAEDLLAAARREFAEELGLPAPEDARDLGTVRTSSGKWVTVWAAEADLDVSAVVSNTFDLEWPTGSGTVCAFPEVDRAGWFSVLVAREKIVKGQQPFLDRLDALLSSG